MIINIKEKATRIKMAYSVFLFLYLVLLVTSFFYDILPSYLFQIIITAVWLIAFIIYFMLKFNYIYFSDDDNKIIFRYQPLNPIKQGAKSIEIPQNKFVKFEIQKAFFGLREDLILYQKFDKGIAKYPSVSISSLNKEEKEKLVKSLNKNS